MNPKAVLSASTLRSIFRPANSAVLVRACRRALLMKHVKAISLATNLDASYRWLCAAQDANLDGGVAGCYNLLRGWGASYPETTGYIIPTFLHYADFRQIPSARERAIRMADWEVQVQLPDGAVRSGMLGLSSRPAVFNTGQVLFGWIAAFGATRDSRYARAASRASEWLTRVQESDGAWRQNLSALTTSSVQTYNVRAAWGLAVAGDELGERRWVDAALRNCDWALTQQSEEGWFAANAFSDKEDPLLHTIGYVLEGLLGVGQLLRYDRYVHAVIKGTEPLIRAYRTNRILKGRYDGHWRPTVSWRCLTGEAQVALVMLRLAKLTGQEKYTETALSLLEGISRLQDLESRHPESYGSITGSEPIWGGYGPFNYLNWAAKFFMDALLLHVGNVDVQSRPRRIAQQARA
jgi:predicted negative regulator of RcsB-dependent stress response